MSVDADDVEEDSVCADKPATDHEERRRSHSSFRFQVLQIQYTVNKHQRASDKASYVEAPCRHRLILIK